MPRHVAFSAKKRRAQLLEKRAIKRGDIEAPDPATVSRRTKKKRVAHHGRTVNLPPGAVDPEERAQAARKLQSAFLKPSRSFLDLSNLLASTVPLPRPVPSDARYPSSSLWEATNDIGCPRRPKWRFDMSKAQVEDNEKRQFDAWLNGAREKIDVWRGAALESSTERIESGELKSPSYFELNLEVWRQLWRVSELSPILLVLLDSRCPPLHIPPSLRSFIADLKPERQLIFVLTKTDIVGQECSLAWKAWLEERFPNTQVILTKSYRQKAGEEERKGQGARKHHEPHLDDDLLVPLIGALRKAHEALLTPPEHIRSNPEKRARWVPRVRESVDWDAVLRSRADPESIRKLNEEHRHVEEGFHLEDEEKSVEGSAGSSTGPSQKTVTGPLTIGLIGQPNVGKSSLLNALFGQTKVRTSRTPGKTKHFQTLFWTPEIRLVDCPGLVLPNYVPMEIQALCSTLQISQIPSLASCIRTLGTLMPLEEILQLTHPSLSHPEPVVQDKRTWRDGSGPKVHQPEDEEPKRPEWTAMDIMTAYALKKGWMTARVGWPDTNRAGNAILRAVAENRVRWTFWPPGSTPVRASTQGIWMVDNGDGSENPESYKGYVSEEEEDDEEEEGRRDSQESEGEGSDESGGDEEEAESDEEEDEDESSVLVKKAATGFGLLAIDSDDDEDGEV